MPDRAPALVVSGFLGSGKTTLVRGLLEQAQALGQRVAVVSNEFGELGIDEALLGSGEEAYVELAGGCVCCKLSDELSDTLQMLWEKVQPDRVIIETSGVAFPFETQLALWREPVNAWVSDDAAVVVVNAEQVAEGRDLEGTFEHQVTSADLLLINKRDLVSAAQLAEVRALLEALSPGTPILTSAHGQVAPDLLFPPDPEELRARRRAEPQAARPHVHEAFSTEELRYPEPVEPEALEDALRALGAVRIKGFVRTPEGPRLVQGVGRRIEVGPLPAPVPPELLGRVVVIRREQGQDHHHGHDHGQGHGHPH
ncbi:MAG: GTP-binding protein [Alphaproteobacteria bacterium]|nr:GTP-binding protein [Alphaproteobacteria bacterium]MCB9796868.1 GTP-binding protein [Alphaproteobacteria bacterium]